MVSLPQRELLTTARRGKNDEVQNSFQFSCNGKNLGHLTHFGKRFDFTVECSTSSELRFKTCLENTGVGYKSVELNTESNF